MKKLLLIALLATSGIVQACKLTFVNNTGALAAIVLDEKIGDNQTPSDMLKWADRNNPQVKIVNSGLMTSTEPNSDRNWIIYLLENNVFVRKCKLSMHACMAETDDAAHTITIADILEHKVDSEYLSVKDF